ncbi:glycosyltransferase family 2 protein [Rufibacter ruber]|uniref:glycosyltransferase family 2 protein n=1 Tax=Rufibacter ruber TaxID=1783499 RepID=UPI000943B0BA|nr:glycosyltransferase family A protein [Rufibacter ruber]
MSIIVPVYNRRETIKETITSVQKQIYQFWELILIDDGSTDGAESIINSSIRLDNRIHYFKRNRLPKGAPTCRNIGLSESKGTYVIFLDSDDILAPYCLEQRVTYMINNPKLDFAVFPMLLFKQKPGDSFVFWNIQTTEADLERFLSFDAPWQTSCPIWRSEALRSIGGWDENALTWQDWEFHIKALALGLKYATPNFLPDCFLRRDESEGRISSADTAEPRFLSRLGTFDATYHLLKKQGLLSGKIENLFARLYFVNAEKAALLGKRLVVQAFIKSIREKKFCEGIIYPYLNALIAFKKMNVPFTLSAAYRFLRIFLPVSLTQIHTNLFKHTLNPEDQKQIQALLKN